MSSDNKQTNNKDTDDQNIVSNSSGDSNQVKNDEQNPVTDEESPKVNWEKIKGDLIELYVRKGVPKQEAEDLVQERIHTFLEKTEEPEKYTHILFGKKSILYSLIKFFREFRKRGKILDEEIFEKRPDLISTDPNVENIEKEKSTAEFCLRKCLDKLPKEDAELYIAYQQMEHGDPRRKDLARSRNIKEGTLRQRIKRIGPKMDSCITKCMKDRGYNILKTINL
jgi:DNA-directed RNA polymerase specialized sigma24 family protein